MPLGVAVLLVLAFAGVMVGAMVLLRRRAPGGGHFVDSDRASGLLGVIGSAFAILLGLVVLFAATNHASAKQHSADEASAVKDMFEGASLLPVRDRVQGDLVCYARAVAGQEWTLMQAGRRSPDVEGWARHAEVDLDGAAVSGARAEAGFQTVLASRNARDTARRERLASATAVIPVELWIALIVAGGTLVAYTMLYADSSERRYSQLFATGAVALLVGTTLMTVLFLSEPFSGHSGAIRPDDMRYSLTLMTQELHGTPPCDAAGRPT